MKNMHISSKNYITKIISIFILFIMVTYSLINISYSLSQTISDNIDAIDTVRYPGIKEKIQQLKAQYPNWNFKILYTNLSWSDVISN